MESSANIFKTLASLFATDDGSLPDIFVENLEATQIAEIYAFVMSLTQIAGNPVLWNLRTKADTPIRSVPDPVAMFRARDCEPFRHALNEFAFAGAQIPQLSMAVDSLSSLSFDYRMGSAWGPNQISALLSFLCKIKTIAPQARIFQSDEGSYDKPNMAFQNALTAHCASLHRV